MFLGNIKHVYSLWYVSSGGSNTSLSLLLCSNFVVVLRLFGFFSYLITYRMCVGVVAVRPASRPVPSVDGSLFFGGLCIRFNLAHSRCCVSLCMCAWVGSAWCWVYACKHLVILGETGTLLQNPICLYLFARSLALAYSTNSQTHCFTQQPWICARMELPHDLSQKERKQRRTLGWAYGRRRRRPQQILCMYVYVCVSA